MGSFLICRLALRLSAGGPYPIVSKNDYRFTQRMPVMRTGIGEMGVAAINAVSHVTGIITFFSTVIAIGSGILYSRESGEMNKRRADEIYGQGMIRSVTIAVFIALALAFCRDAYFRANGVTGEIYELANAYYQWTPLNAALNVMVSYLTQMVYTDGDETCNNISYGFQIGGNIVLSVFLARSLNMMRFS